MSDLEPIPTIVFSGLSDEAWREVIVATLQERNQKGVLLPGFAAEELQRGSVGSAGEHALREGFRFYQLVKSYGAELGHPIGWNSKVLDFGCGWGRMLRFFLKEVSPDNLYGWDVDPTMIATCKETFPYCQFEVVGFAPPAPVPDAFFDCIYAYSVFSHLAENVHLQWVREFSRILKPGGVLLATTQGRGFIDFCASLRATAQHESGWHRALARSFVDREQCLRDYDAGRFLHAANGGGEHRSATFYGDSLIPKGYVERAWTPYLSLRVFRDDPAFLPQALIVMQKPLRTEALSASAETRQPRKLKSATLLGAMKRLMMGGRGALSGQLPHARPIAVPPSAPQRITFVTSENQPLERIGAPDYMDLHRDDETSSVGKN